MKESELIPVMNDTKWDELRLAMYSLGKLHPMWRIKDVETGFISNWDGEWFYHFRNGGYKTIEWVEIEITSQEQVAEVHAALKQIHLPGERIEKGYRIVGYAAKGQQVSYIE